MSTAREFRGFAAWLVTVGVVGALGALASRDAPDFYARLTKPVWAPPAALFGPVWTFLYLLMAVAAWLIWSRHGFRAGRSALTLFLVQLGLNAVWSWLFFAWHRGAWAFVDVVALWVLILVTASAFWRLRPIAGALLLPYLAWVTFAAALNLAVWRLNPQLL